MSTITLDELVAMGMEPRLDHVCKCEGKADIGLFRWDVGGVTFEGQTDPDNGWGTIYAIRIIAGAKTAMRLLQEAK